MAVQEFQDIVERAKARPYPVPKESAMMLSMAARNDYKAAFLVCERLLEILSCDFISRVVSGLESSGHRVQGTAMTVLKRYPRYMAVSLMTSQMPYHVSLEYYPATGVDLNRSGYIPLLIVNKIDGYYVIDCVPTDDLKRTLKIALGTDL